ncbi:MAG TPA: BON domain-containing protein [Verrucomicrobiae bacterium]|nr:BON domain-containing protein [Verrucomicrobiae bacterium]
MNFKSRLALSLVAAVACNCAIKPTPETFAPQPKVPPKATVKNSAVEESPSDETIGLEIRRRFEAQAPGDTAGLVIEVDGGIVTLRGAAPTQAAAWRAQSVAWSVKGVKLVRNQIIIANRSLIP